MLVRSSLQFQDRPCRPQRRALLTCRTPHRLRPDGRRLTQQTKDRRDQTRDGGASPAPTPTVHGQTPEVRLGLKAPRIVGQTSTRIRRLPSRAVSTLPPRRSPTSPTRSGRLGRKALVVVLAGLLLVVGKAGPAQAHVVGIGGRAGNYRTDVLDVTPPTPGLTVRVLEAGNQLELTNRSDREVVVVGYRSEPCLRVCPAGVYDNKRSPSACANRFANAPSRIPADLDPAAPPQWRRIRNQPDAVWHDHRSHWSGPDPPAVTADRGHRQVIVPNWQIPL